MWAAEMSARGLTSQPRPAANGWEATPGYTLKLATVHSGYSPLKDAELPILTALDRELDSSHLVEGCKYACIALSIPFLDVQAPLHFDEHLSVHPSFNAEVPDHWHEWLGSIFRDRLAHKNLIIRAAQISTQPEILDAEHDKLANCTSRYFEALMLFGPKIASIPLLLKGSQVDGALSIRHIGDLVGRVRHEASPYTAVDTTKLWGAYRIYLKLSEMEAKGTGWFRFSKGLRALRQASSEGSILDRTHHWVRALEALLMTDRGQATRQFTERCQMFTGQSSGNAAFFADAYNTRSLVEHMNDVDSLKKPGETQSDASNRVHDQSADLEMVALEVYRRILSDHTLIAVFETDATAKAFWAQDTATREGVWGDLVDIAAIKLTRQKEVATLHG